VGLLFVKYGSFDVLRSSVAITTNVVHSTLILLTLMIEVIRPSETSTLARTTRCYSPEDGILHSHRREYIKSYVTTDWAL
jgi:hypothetical protein